ncbi:MAG: hypothetical protein N2379_03315 [Verrucomicrobiae bacterium]|nr:hypothetical protein [Verrucomicrobiae bacterium]
MSRNGFELRIRLIAFRAIALSCGIIWQGLICTAQPPVNGTEPAPRTVHEKVPLPIVLPPPSLKGTPEDIPKGPNIEPPPDPDKPPTPFLAPKGVTNVALGKPVTASVKPFSGELAQITDGKKDPYDDQVVELRRGTQWVQVDLGAPHRIYAIVMWHDHRYLQVVHDVIVQVADDAEFTQNVRTLFNNDTDNTSGLGPGTDREYFETRFGKIVDAKGAVARYVRCYTRGSSLSAINVWQEIEVYGTPAE